MIKSMTKKMNNKKGFTLIELIVVIAILGILAAIAIPRLGGFQESSRQAADEQYASIVANSAIMYMATNDDTLPTIEDLEDANLIETGVELVSDKYTEIGIAAGTSSVTVVVTLTSDPAGDNFVVSK